MDILARSSAPIGFECLPALPELFDRVAFNQPAIRRLLSRTETSFRGKVPVNRDFAFVRGAMALSAQDFSAAQDEFSVCARRFPETASGLASAVLIDLLDRQPLTDPDYAVIARGGDVGVDFRRFAGKRILVVSDAPLETVDAVLAQLPANATSKAFVRHSFEPERVAPNGHEYDLPDAFVWYGKEGKAIHARLKHLADAMARGIARRATRLSAVGQALSLLLCDTCAYDYRLVRRVAAALHGERWDAVLVASANFRLFQIVRDLAAPVVGRDQVVSISDRPLSLSPQPSLPFWPSARSARTAAVRMPRHRTGDTRLGRRFGPGGTALGPRKAGRGLRSALMVWSVTDDNYIAACCNVIEEALSRRPVTLLISNDESPLLAKLEERLSAIAARARHGIRIFRCAPLLALGRQDPMFVFRLHATAQETTADLLRESSLDPADAAFVRHHLLPAATQSDALRGIAAAMGWLDNVIARAPPAYVLTAPGRLPLLAAVAERCQADGIDATDVHLYFVADWARQLRPPHRFVAVVDSHTEQLLGQTWKIDPSCVVRVGFLWMSPGRGTAPSRRLPDAAAGLAGKSKIIVFATQPSPVDLTRRFTEPFLAMVSGDDDIGVLIKPHRGELPAAVDYYKRAVRRFRLGDRVAVLEKGEKFAALLDVADLVVTRFSNGGLEAAARYKPVVRGIFIDTFMPAWWLEAEYAVNSRSPQDMARDIRDLLYDEKRKQALRAKQERFFAANPALVDPSGARRLIDFVEARLVKGTRRA